MPCFLIESFISKLEVNRTGWSSQKMTPAALWAFSKLRPKRLRRWANLTPVQSVPLRLLSQVLLGEYPVCVPLVGQSFYTYSPELLLKQYYELVMCDQWARGLSWGDGGIYHCLPHQILPSSQWTWADPIDSHWLAVPFWIKR